MKAVVPAALRSWIEPELPDGVTALWWSDLEDAARLIPDADVAWLDLLSIRQIGPAVAKGVRLKWLSTMAAGVESLDLAMLRDNRVYFPPYYAVPIVRSAVLLAHPELREALNELAGRISEDDMRAMNASVDVEHRDVAATVKDFLRAKLAN